jgi:hypothetical protein
MNVLLVGMLIGFCCCYTLRWVNLWHWPLDFLVATLVIGLLDVPILWACSVADSGGSCCQCIYMLCPLGVAITACVFVSGAKTHYTDSVSELWTQSGIDGFTFAEFIELRESMETKYTCCTWENMTAKLPCQEPNPTTTCDLALRAPIATLSTAEIVGVSIAFVLLFALPFAAFIWLVWRARLARLINLQSRL